METMQEKRKRQFEEQLSKYNVSGYEREFKFATPVGVNYAFDYAYPKSKVAIELEGGIFSGQAHGSGSGIMRDIEKYNLAAYMGWRLFRFPANILDNQTKTSKWMDDLSEFVRKYAGVTALSNNALFQGNS